MSRNQFIKMSALTLIVVTLLTVTLAAGDLLAKTFAAAQQVAVQLQDKASL